MKITKGYYKRVKSLNKDFVRTMEYKIKESSKYGELYKEEKDK